MTCELKHNAYQDLYKKGEFFDDVDKPRKFMESRLKAIVKAVNTLDQCHKQTLKFLKMQAQDEDVVLNKRDLQEIFDQNEIEKFNMNRRNSEQSHVPVKTVLEDTTQNTFLTTCDVWQDSNLMKFI